MKTLAGNLDIHLYNFILAVILGGIISIFSLKFGFLTKSGTISTFILAVLIFTLGSWKWTIPIVTFFVVSSLLSKIRSENKSKVQKHFEKTGQRDIVQVLSNGGIAGLLVIISYLFQNEIFFILFCGSIAAVCADTWATEIGTLFKSKTINILTFREVEQGRSGGISLFGTIGAFLGAVIISCVSLFWLENDVIFFFLIIIIAGFLGSLLDSILGSAVQAQYKCKICSEFTEKSFHCNSGTEFIKGVKWINNDAVNFFTSLSGSILAFVLIKIIK